MATQRERYAKWLAKPGNAEAAAAYHRQYNREWHRRRYASEPEFREAHRRSRIKCAYGVTPEEYEAMLAAQGGVCAIRRRQDTRRLSIDHDHRTDEVRGLLCRHCNLMIGQARDNPALLLAAVAYLT